MGNDEKNYNEIKKAVLQISVNETGTVLQYRSRDYYVDPISPQGPIAEFFESTYYSGGRCVCLG